MFRDRTEPTLFRAGTVPETVPVRSLLFVHALKGKWLELSTSNFVHVYYIAVTQHALTQRSKRSEVKKVKGHMVTKIITVSPLLVTMSRILHTNTPLCYLWPLPAWSACPYDCLCFLVTDVLIIVWFQVPLSRRVIKQGLSQMCKVEVYLIDLQLFHSRDMKKPVIRHFSHVDTLGE